MCLGELTRYSAYCLCRMGKLHCVLYIYSGKNTLRIVIILVY